MLFGMEQSSLVRFKILGSETDNLLEMYEREVPPHTIGADPHLHLTTVETFYVVEGFPTILVGDDRRQHGPGSVVVVPMNVAHGYWNETDQPIKVVIAFTPALGHHEFFRGLSQLKAGPKEEYQEKLAALRLRFDSVSLPQE
jgi:quercetin dioxygenase-like cupin family protein